MNMQNSSSTTAQKEVYSVNNEIDVINSMIHYCEDAAESFDCDESVDRLISKLKSWRRLREKGFHFICWASTFHGDEISFYIDPFEYDSETKFDLSNIFDKDYNDRSRIH